MSVRAEFLATTRRSVADALRALGSRITEGEAKLLGGLDARLSRFLVDFERLERHADVASARPDSNSEERELWHILLKMELLRLDELFDTAVERQAQMLVVHFREVRRCNAMLIRRAIERFRPLEDKGDNVGVAGSATDQTKAQFDWTAFFVQILRRPAFSSDRIARHVMQQKMQKDSFQCSCVYCKVEPARSPVLLPCAHLSCKACLGDTPSVLECPSCKCVFAWSAVPAVDPIVDSHIRSLFPYAEGQEVTAAETPEVDTSESESSTVQSFSATAPVTPKKPDVSPKQTETTARRPAVAANAKVSCHQCKIKSVRPSSHLLFCSSDVPRPKGTRACRKKYCRRCLLKYYTSDEVDKLMESGGAWTCPACTKKCICAKCQRDRGIKVQKRAKPGTSQRAQRKRAKQSDHDAADDADRPAKRLRTGPAIPTDV
ncbi:MAG: hypothetical protein MHM6MM_003640 [Cercozoa sp. M6MM]